MIPAYIFLHEHNHIFSPPQSQVFQDTQSETIWLPALQWALCHFREGMLCLQTPPTVCFLSVQLGGDPLWDIFLITPPLCSRKWRFFSDSTHYPCGNYWHICLSLCPQHFTPSLWQSGHLIYVKWVGECNWQNRRPAFRSLSYCRWDKAHLH